MSHRAPKDGRILSSGVVKAAEIAAGLGLGGPEPEIQPTRKLTPAQQRAQDENKPLPPSPDGYEEVTIPGGQDVWEHLGRPAIEAAPGSPDGTPVPSMRGRPPSAQPQRTDWDSIDNRDSETSTPSPAELAEQLRQDATEHARRQMVRVKEAEASGDPERTRRVAEDAQASASLVRRIAEKIGSGE